MSEENLQKEISSCYAPIGVFDSGVGGLTVAREIMRQLPAERIVYFGDTARVPYGSKSQDTIIRFSRQIIRFLQSKGVKAIVIACNTASALALETVQPEFDIPILGVVKAGAKEAAKVTKNGKIGVIATESTIESQLYTKEIHSHKPNAQVLGKPCPLFVPLVEEGWLKDPVTVEVANRYLEPLLESGIDTLIMGCTHYPLLRSTLRQIMGEKVNLVNPAYETAVELKTLLRDMDLTRSSEDLERFSEENSRRAAAGEPILDQYQFFVSDRAENFTRFAKAILPKEVKDTKQINIEEY